VHCWGENEAISVPMRAPRILKPCIAVEEDSDIAGWLTIKVIDHHSTPGVSQERNVGEPLPSNWNLVKDNEETAKVHTNSDIGWKQGVGSIHVWGYGCNEICQDDANH